MARIVLECKSEITLRRQIHLSTSKKNFTNWRSEKKGKSIFLWNEKKYSSKLGNRTLSPKLKPSILANLLTSPENPSFFGPDQKSKKCWEMSDGREGERKPLFCRNEKKVLLLTMIFTRWRRKGQFCQKFIILCLSYEYIFFFLDDGRSFQAINPEIERQMWQLLALVFISIMNYWNTGSNLWTCLFPGLLSAGFYSAVRRRWTIINQRNNSNWQNCPENRNSLNNQVWRSSQILSPKIPFPSKFSEISWGKKRESDRITN